MTTGTRPIASLAQEDWGTGRWDGGRATLTDPIIRYRTSNGPKGQFTVVECYATMVDQEENKHQTKWYMGDSEYTVIRADANEDSDEAAEGYAVSHRKPGQQWRLNPESEMGMLLASLYSEGFPQLTTGDVRELDGVDADWKGQAKPKDKENKFPIIICAELHAGAAKGKGRGKGAAAKPAAKATASAKKPAVVDDPEEQTAEELAVSLIVIALEDVKDGESIDVGELTRATAKQLRSAEAATRKEVLGFWSDPDWLVQQDAFTYKKKTGAIFSE